MSSPQTWKSFFADWPTEFPRRGVMLTVLNEIIPYNNFWIQEEMVLLERKNPDTSGSRFIMITYDRIDSIRFIDPINESVIATAGFAAATPATV